ncbi:MAG TPA: hypothetical protein VFL83_14700 [Anaeromyxobacter sp.]|nr:hypothetical protein [Anaeromyxobacter sp.]
MHRSWVKSGFQVAVAVALAGYAVLGRADPGSALEIAVGTAYTQGVGAAAGGGMPTLQTLAGGGGTLRVDVGWRIDRRWMVGAYHENVLLAAGDVPGTDRVTGHALGLQGQLHLAPSTRLDPWVGLGCGWRSLSIDHGMGTHELRGLDLARVEVGLDWRLSPSFGVAPAVGVAVTELLSEQRPGESGWMDLEDRSVGAFVFAGVSGRFDL